MGLRDRSGWHIQVSCDLELHFDAGFAFYFTRDEVLGICNEGISSLVALDRI